MTLPPAGDPGPAAALRARLVETLRARGALHSPAVLEAFARVPRHVFVPEVPVEEAYRDRWIATRRTPDGEVISSSSQPEIMAIMLEQLEVRPGQRVLEIGAGTGYHAALLAHLAGPTGTVTTVDLDPDLADGARRHLAAAGVPGVRVVCGDGWEGWAEGGPWDRIVLTAVHPLRARLAGAGPALTVSGRGRRSRRPGGRGDVVLVVPGGQALGPAAVAARHRAGGAAGRWGPLSPGPARRRRPARPRPPGDGRAGGRAGPPPPGGRAGR